MGLDDQPVRGPFEHRREDRAGHAESRLLGREGLGGAGKENAELPPTATGPVAFGLEAGAVGVLGIGADLQERAPGPALQDVPRVPDVAARPAERRSEWTAPIRLERMRGDPVQVAGRAGQDRADGDVLGLHRPILRPPTNPN